MEEKASFFKVEKDILLVSFKTKRDRDKILDGGPWSFDFSALLMQEWKSGMTGEDVCNTKINIWEHLHRLPFELRNDTFAKDLAGIAGKVKDNSGHIQLLQIFMVESFSNTILSWIQRNPSFPVFFFRGKTENLFGFI